jgi:hypothetical protein
MTGQQQAIEQALEAVRRGEWTDDVNILVIRIMGVRLIQAPIPREIRKTLNRAVREGKLGRIPRKGLRPEAYHHPNTRARAREEQNKVVLEAIERISRVIAR